MLKYLLTAVITAFFLNICGCGIINKKMVREMRQSESRMRIQSSQRNYNKDYLDSLNYQGEISVDKINVQYQSGLKDQAGCIGNQFSYLLDKVSERVGLDLPFDEINLKLIRAENIPSSFSYSSSFEPNSLTFPLWVEMGSESCEHTLSRQSIYPYMLVHEIFEIALIFPEEGAPVMMDYKWNLGGLIGGEIKNYTRWFREGFANYAGFVAGEILLEEEGLIDPDDKYASAHLLHTTPFTWLSKNGTEIFKWDQFDGPGRKYEAALGLFLLLREEYGEESIRKIVSSLKKADYVDGDDLKDIINEQLGIDIVKLVKDFDFPFFGIRAKEVTPLVRKNQDFELQNGLFLIDVDPNGLAGSSGLKKGDVILEVAGTDISDMIDYQMAIYDQLGSETVNMTIWRRKEGQMEIELMLKKKKNL